MNHKFIRDMPSFQLAVGNDIEMAIVISNWFKITNMFSNTEMFLKPPHLIYAVTQTWICRDDYHCLQYFCQMIFLLLIYIINDHSFSDTDKESNHLYHVVQILLTTILYLWDKSKISSIVIKFLWAVPVGDQ